MPRTIETRTTVYQYDELSPDAQEAARDWWREGALDFYDWWDCTFQDAESIGCKIESFDCGRSQEIGFKFTVGANEVARRILARHGKTCDTWKCAAAWVSEGNRRLRSPRLRNGKRNGHYSGDRYDSWSDACRVFRADLAKCYLRILADEIEYLTSDESAEETIRANEYEFTANGKRYVR